MLPPRLQDPISLSFSSNDLLWKCESEDKVKYNCWLNLEDSHAQTGDVHETVLDFEMKGLTEHRAGFWFDGVRFFRFYNLEWMAVNAIMFMMKFILVGKGWITLEPYSHWFDKYIRVRCQGVRVSGLFFLNFYFTFLFGIRLSTFVCILRETLTYVSGWQWSSLFLEHLKFKF